MITKILGFIYRIALSRIIGDEGMGLIQMSFPILIFAIVVTTAGIPVAISKLVSEAEARNEEERIPSILMVSTFIVVITSVIVTSCVFLFMPLVAKFLLTDERTIYALLAMAPIIPIIAISSIFRGYFQGRQNMSPYAISQIVEQIVRIFTVLLLAHILLPYGIEYAAAGAMIGMVIGEGMGMFYIINRFRKDPKRPLLFSKQKNTKGFKQSFRDVMRITIPVTLSKTIGSLAYAIEPIVVSQSLAIAGIATAAATALYGQLEGMAIPLVFFPAFITYALSVSLVPAISEAAAQKKMNLVELRLQQAIRLSLIVGAPCTILIYIMAEPLSILLYHEPVVTKLIQVLAPVSLIHYLQGPFAAVLQGLDKAHIAMRNSIIGAVIKIALIFVLASRTDLGIIGVAMAINVGIVLVTGLHFLSIIRSVPLTFVVKDYLKLSIAIFLMSITAQFFISQPHHSLFVRVILTTIGGTGVYLICVLVLALIRKHDIERIPQIGHFLAKFFPS